MVDALRDGMFLSTRIYPKITMIVVDKVESKLIVKFPDGNHVKIDLDEVWERNDVRKAV
jgi:hypothetical protein